MGFGGGGGGGGGGGEGWGSSSTGAKKESLYKVQVRNHFVGRVKDFESHAQHVHFCYSSGTTLCCFVTKMTQPSLYGCEHMVAS
jgi:hypothetical protein